ncbi:hypothetical protein F511_42525 [Dorcoceras hygrometricum]|uniref:Uncharacterized protein n=1 Tax=Dorcoceras hygrometricum TaxID=472368 RepID=A0A2Z7BWH8_9LAMI|nr:hypothetical protein F511_42525 [Dorcoceras hygrometricum]
MVGRITKRVRSDPFLTSGIREDMVESLSAEMLEQEAAVVKVGEEVISVDQRENDPVVVVSRRFVMLNGQVSYRVEISQLMSRPWIQTLSYAWIQLLVSIQMLKTSVVGTSSYEVFRYIVFVNLQKGNNSDVKTISQ